MIAIVNVGPHTNAPGGERNYEVRINRDVIATFKHRRADGLATCLRRAAKAVDDQREFEETQLLIEIYNTDKFKE